MASNTIEAKSSGPLIFKGTCKALDADGEEITSVADGKLQLCGCGRSARRPLCDGSHNSAPFPPPDPDQG
jgi:CDGSH-type Zn-finger protein